MPISFRARRYSARVRRIRVTLTTAVATAAVFAALPQVSAAAPPISSSPSVSATPTPAVSGRDWSGFQWHLDALGLRAVHAAGFTGRGATIAVLDGPFALSHGDLAGAVDESFEVRRAKVRPVVSPPTGKDAVHGTHVASLAAARADGSGVTGVAPDARLIVGNVLTGIGNDIENIAAGIRHVAGRADVVNLSLGVEQEYLKRSEREVLCSAVSFAFAEGTVTVVAAGNERLWGNPALNPAVCADALSVAALDANLEPAYFASSDESVLLSAPGVAVVGAVPAGSLSEGFSAEESPVAPLSGSSMAAPLVSGVAALVAAEGNMSAADVRAALLDKALDRGVSGRDAVFGFGVVSPADVLGLSLPAPAPVPVPHLGVNMVEPGRSGVFTEDGRVHWSWDVPRSGSPVESVTVTFTGYAADGSLEVSRREVPARQVRGSMPASAAYGWLTVQVGFPGASALAGPFPVFPHDEHAPVVEEVEARWVDSSKLEAGWTLRRPLHLSEGEDLHTMAWYDSMLDLPAPVVEPKTLAYRSGAVSGVSRLALGEEDPVLEKAWRQWYDGGHLLAVVVCRGDVSAWTFDCARSLVKPTLPLSVTVAKARPGFSTVRVQANRWRSTLCSAYSSRTCAGRGVKVSLSGLEYKMVLDATGLAVVEVPRVRGNTVSVTVKARARSGPVEMKVRALVL